MREVKRPGAVGAAPRPKGKTDLADRLPTTSPTHAAQVPPPRPAYRLALHRDAGAVDPRR
jgi:hypothetical protein